MTSLVEVLPKLPQTYSNIYAIAYQVDELIGNNVTTNYSHATFYELTEGGCRLNDNEDGPANCTAVCANQSLVYSSLETFNNCLLAPCIAAALSKGTHHNISDAQDAEDVGISAFPILNSNYTGVIADCIQAACESSASCSTSSP